MAGVVPGLSLFSNITKPKNCSPDSACSLETPWYEISYVRTMNVDLPLELLSSQPGETFDALACHGDNPVTALSVVRQQVVIVLRD